MAWMAEAATVAAQQQAIRSASGMVSTAEAITSTVNRRHCAAAARIAVWWPRWGG